MDCFTSFAMTKKRTVIARVAFATRGNLVYSRLVIVRLRRRSGNLVYSWLVIAKAKGLWQSRYGVQFHSQNAFIFVLFLFFFVYK